MLPPILAIALIFILGYALMSFINWEKTNLKEDYIGKNAVEIIKTYSEAEKVLFYIDQSAKYSIEKAYSKDKNEEDFLKEFLNYFNEYLQKLEATKNIKYELDELSVQSNYLIGNSEKELIFKEPSFTYKVKVKFKQKIKLDLKEEEELFKSTEPATKEATTTTSDSLFIS